MLDTPDKGDQDQVVFLWLLGWLGWRQATQAVDIAIKIP